MERTTLASLEPGTEFRLPSSQNVWVVQAQSSDCATRKPYTQVFFPRDDDCRSWPGRLIVEVINPYVREAHADADFLETCLFDDQGIANALAVFVCDPRLRKLIAEADPQALAQARDALGLTTVSV